MLINITSNDAGLYICSILKNSSSDTMETEMAYQQQLHVQVKVKTKPGLCFKRKKKDRKSIFM